MPATFCLQKQFEDVSEFNFAVSESREERKGIKFTESDCAAQMQKGHSHSWVPSMALCSVNPWLISHLKVHIK